MTNLRKNEPCPRRLGADGEEAQMILRLMEAS